MNNLIDVEYAPLTKEEQNVLVQKIKNGDNTKIKDLISANSKFLCQLAHFYSKDSYDFEDAYQDAVLGMLDAVKTYKEDKNCSFLAYSVNYIKNACHVGYLRQYKISLPKISNYYLALMGAEGSGLGEKANKNISSLKINSLEELISGDIEKSFDIKDERYNAFDFIKEDMINYIHRAINEMDVTDKQRSIFIQLHGLNGSKPKTLREVAEEFNVSRQAISSNNSKCIQKLIPVLKRYGIDKESIGGFENEI